MSAELIYWDSDAFLGLLQNEDGKADLCSHTIERATSGEVIIITSTLTIAEVLWMRGAPKIPKEKSRSYKKIFSAVHISV